MARMLRPRGLPGALQIQTVRGSSFFHLSMEFIKPEMLILEIALLLRQAVTCSSKAAAVSCRRCYIMLLLDLVVHQPIRRAPRQEKGAMMWNKMGVSKKEDILCMQVMRGAAQRAESALPDALTFVPVKVGLQPDP